MAELSNKNRKPVPGASARKLWFRSDIIVIFALLAIALVLYFAYAAFANKDSKPYLEIIYDGNIVLTDDLSEDKSFSIEQLPNVVFEIKDGSAAFIESDCPDKICVQSGYLHEPGQTAACLPNHAIIRIMSDGGADTPDVVV